MWFSFRLIRPYWHGNFVETVFDLGRHGRPCTQVSSVSSGVATSSAAPTERSVSWMHPENWNHPMRVALWILCFTVFTIASELLFSYTIYIIYHLRICSIYSYVIILFNMCCGFTFTSVHSSLHLHASETFRNRGLWSPCLRTTPLLGHLQRQGSHFRSFWRWAPVDIDHIEWIDCIKSIFQRKKNINDSDTGFVGWQECFWCLAGFGSTATGLVPRKQQTATPAGEASLTTFVQTWCIEAAYMAETMAPSHVANTPLSSRCEVKCAKTHQCSLSWQSESAESSLQHIEHQWTVYQTRRMSKARPLAYA